MVETKAQLLPFYKQENNSKYALVLGGKPDLCMLIQGPFNYTHLQLQNAYILYSTGGMVGCQ